MKWIAAYNLPTKEWGSGGSRSEYDQKYYDIYEVRARDRDDAIEQARKIRRSTLSLTPNQKQLLWDLKEQVLTDGDGQTEDKIKTCERFTIEINIDEISAARRLVKLGLIRWAVEDDDRQVIVMIDAFNPSLDPTEESRARISQKMMDTKTAAASNKKKPGMRL